MKKISMLSMALMVAASAAFAEVNNGEPAPEFTLTDTKGTSHNLSDFRGKYVVLEWVNHGCPFVVKFYSVGKMQEFQQAVTADGDVIWLSICSSAEGKQGHMSSDAWNAKIEESGTAATAVLIDADGTVGKLYGAKVTPHMYVIDPEGTLIYQGAIDSVRSTDSADIDSSENYVMAALAQHKAGEEIVNAQTTAYGCGVKYKD
jgi:peroxiredoxin